jgi:hypothetical protein
MKDEDVALSTSASSLAIWHAHLGLAEARQIRNCGQTHQWCKPLNHNTVTKSRPLTTHTSAH